MIRCKFLVAACMGTFVYVLASVVCGRNSVWAARQLDEQKRQLSMHTAAIEKTNEELNLEKIMLEKDMDVIAAYARKLSYVGEGEMLVKISGLSLSEASVYDPGTVMLHKGVTCMSEKFCKGAGFLVFALFYFILLFFDVTCSVIKGHHEHKYYDRRQGAVVL